jgi:hypothetical protein
MIEGACRHTPLFDSWVLICQVETINAYLYYELQA